MGDRSFVSLTVMKEHGEQVGDIYDDMPDRSLDGASAIFEFNEVNYGELEHLDQLQTLGIAYDSHWEDGGEYTAGTQSCRFNEAGEAIVKSIYDDEIGTIDLGPVSDAADISLDEVIKVINARKDVLHVLPWDNQVEYGKRYLARKLIEPNTE